MLAKQSNMSNLEESAMDMQMTPVIQKPYDSSKELVESRIVRLSLKAHKYWTDRFPVEANLDDTVLRLKKMILVDLRTLAGFEMENVAVEKMMLHSSHPTRVELLDHQILRDCAVSDNHEIDLSIND